MTTEYQAAMARLAADTKQACATSADVVQAAKAKATTKVAEAEATTAATKSAGASKAAAAKPAAQGLSYHAKAAFLTHPYLFSLAGGVVIGIVAYRFANKYWLNK